MFATATQLPLSILFAVIRLFTGYMFCFTSTLGVSFCVGYDFSK